MCFFITHSDAGFFFVIAHRLVITQQPHVTVKHRLILLRFHRYSAVFAAEYFPIIMTPHLFIEVYAFTIVVVWHIYVLIQL